MVDAKTVASLRKITGAGMLDCKNALVETNGNIEKAVDYLREKGIAKAVKKASRIAAEGLVNIYIEGNTAIIIEVNSETDFVSKNEEFIEMIDLIGKSVLKSRVTTLEDALNLEIGAGTINDLIIAKTSKIGEKLSFRRFELVTKNDNEEFGSYLHLGGKIASLIVLEGESEKVAKDVAMQVAAMKPDYISKEDILTEKLEKEKKILTEEVLNEGKPAEIAEKIVAGKLNKFYKEICLIHQPFIKENDIDVATYVKNNNSKVINMIRYEVGEGMEKRSENFAEEVMSQIK
ncbi:MAG: translation elongation factor Ts [Bacilli bacterium]|nr:translation elongation factor Ts [Bacilli bacterium]